MDYKKDSERIKQAFAKEFDIAIELIARKYARHTRNKVDDFLSEDISRIIIGTALIKKLKEIEVDA